MQMIVIYKSFVQIVKIIVPWSNNLFSFLLSFNGLLKQSTCSNILKEILFCANYKSVSCMCLYFHCSFRVFLDRVSKISIFCRFYATIGNKIVSN